MRSRLYLDHAATTPLLPAAAEAMQPWLAEGYGNPSSLHAEGRHAKAALDEAREIVSQALGCAFGEVLFTSGGTEAANWALIGTALANEDPRRRVVLMGAAEHHCVLHTRPLLEKLGYEVREIPVDRQGRAVLDAIGRDVLLVSLMHANNELGSWNDLRPWSQSARDAGALLHTDAVQTFLHEDPFLGGPWTVDSLGVDLLSVAAHKVHGPKGVGALYVRAGVKPKPLVVGGGQEREQRAGTENVAGIVGFAVAVRALNGLPTSGQKEARDRFLGLAASGGASASVTDAPVLPGHAHLRFPGLDAETMLIRLDRAGVAASSGAACSSGSLEPSHVLLACGYSVREAREGLRFSFGRFSSIQEAEEAAERVLAAANAIRR